MHREAGYDACAESRDGLDDLGGDVWGSGGIFERRKGARHGFEKSEGCLDGRSNGF